VLLAFVIPVFLVSCPDPDVPNQTPVAGDYTFGNLSQTAGNVIAVAITAKSGKSPGTIGNIRYNNSTTIPQTVGTFAVTFDVAAASGWNDAPGLFAGVLIVNPADNGNQTPAADDYTFEKLEQTAGSVTAVIITAKEGVSPGAISNIRYDDNFEIPQIAGTYAVTFDVAAALGWNAAEGLSAGDLTVNPPDIENQTPAADDYIFGKLSQTAGSVTAVTITAKEGKSPGTIGNIRYAGNSEIPQAVGTFAVTFDVAAASGWNAAYGLSAGNLTVSLTPILEACTHNGAEYLPGNHQTLPMGTGCTCVNIPGVVVNTIPVTNRNNLTAAVFDPMATAVNNALNAFVGPIYSLYLPVIKSNVQEIRIVQTAASDFTAVKSGNKYIVSIKVGTDMGDIAMGFLNFVHDNNLAPIPAHCNCPNGTVHEAGDACCLGDLKSPDCTCTEEPAGPPPMAPCTHGAWEYLPGEWPIVDPPHGAGCECQVILGAVCRFFDRPITNRYGIPQSDDPHNPADPAFRFGEIVAIINGKIEPYEELDMDAWNDHGDSSFVHLYKFRNMIEEIRVTTDTGNSTYDPATKIITVKSGDLMDIPGSFGSILAAIADGTYGMQMPHDNTIRLAKHENKSTEMDKG
jgi:hypothetical protein